MGPNVINIIHYLILFAYLKNVIKVNPESEVSGC